MEGLLIGIFLFALCLFSFYMYVRLLAYSESRWQTQMLQEQLDAYALRVAGIEGFQRRTGEMQHEFKNILFSLNIDAEQGNYDQVKHRTAELLGDYKKAEPERYTGNTLVDALVAYKAVRLRELGAELSVQADLLDPDLSAPGIADSGALAHDLAAIMGIALDNVTDACELLHDADPAARPPVYCGIQKKPPLLLIQLTNPLPKPLLYKGGEIRSTKAESGHGLGLSALRRIAQKYGGKVAISDAEGTFSLTVTLFV
jgi:two-component system CitB family sensor kinase